MLGVAIGVGVPRLKVAGVDLDDADAAFDQAPRQQAVRREHGIAFACAKAIHRADAVGFATDVESLGSGGLHAEGHLERFDAGIERRLMATALDLKGVHLLNQIELAPLAFRRQCSIRQMWDDVRG